jgi:hypothetical protein
MFIVLIEDTLLVFLFLETLLASRLEVELIIASSISFETSILAKSLVNSSYLQEAKLLKVLGRPLNKSRAKKGLGTSCFNSLRYIASD